MIILKNKPVKKEKSFIKEKRKMSNLKNISESNDVSKIVYAICGEYYNYEKSFYDLSSTIYDINENSKKNTIDTPLENDEYSLSFITRQYFSGAADYEFIWNLTEKSTGESINFAIYSYLEYEMSQIYCTFYEYRVVKKVNAYL